MNQYRSLTRQHIVGVTASSVLGNNVPNLMDVAIIDTDARRLGQRGRGQELRSGPSGTTLSPTLDQARKERAIDIVDHGYTSAWNRHQPPTRIENRSLSVSNSGAPEPVTKDYKCAIIALQERIVVEFIINQLFVPPKRLEILRSRILCEQPVRRHSRISHVKHFHGVPARELGIVPNQDHNHASIYRHSGHRIGQSCSDFRRPTIVVFHRNFRLAVNMLLDTSNFHNYTPFRQRIKHAPERPGIMFPASPF